ncbi:YraN family protein [Candidatus Dependentiae bacterium]|nr:YraN family protein [Candidatus Dependentiae bacterium]
MNEAQALGCTGESLVVRFLEERGYRVRAKNYLARAGSVCLGEVDIIAEKDEFLVFVEVKTRKIAYFPISTVVTRSKQQRIIKAAKMFLAKHGLYYERVSRFDVATVVYSDTGEYDIEYIENAFGV